MGINTDIQTQIDRKTTQITTAETRITELELLEVGNSITIEEQTELDELRDIILPDLNVKKTQINSILSKLGDGLGEFGSSEGMFDNPSKVTSIMTKEAGAFKCNIDIGSPLDIFNVSFDDLNFLKGISIDLAWGDDLDSINLWLSKISSINLNFGNMDLDLSAFKIQLGEFAASIKAIEWNLPTMPSIEFPDLPEFNIPCTNKSELIEKMMPYQSASSQALYNDLNAASTPTERSSLIKSAMDSIKI